ncbi:MAG: barstar family protein [Clostridia bacterium]|nr:barstar family protein [Clostridia bacterium]
MQTIYLDADRLKSGEDVHRALKLLLDLPDYYGHNADALYDCLSERTEPVRLTLRNAGNEDVAATLSKVCRVIEDLDGEIIRL